MNKLSITGWEKRSLKLQVISLKTLVNVGRTLPDKMQHFTHQTAGSARPTELKTCNLKLITCNFSSPIL